MMKRTHYSYSLRLFILIALGILIAIGCKRNFPEDLSAFSLDMDFRIKEYRPILGRNTSYVQNFNEGNSSKPLTFRISSIRDVDGKIAYEFLKPFPVLSWKENYTGEEKSLAEINAKRDTLMRPLWEIGKHNGGFTMWEAARSNVVKSFPDSGYYFDVEVSSSGGRRYFKDLRLIPYPEDPYSIGHLGINLLGDSTRTVLRGFKIWCNKVGEGNSITFKALDPQLKPISWAKFNKTDWEGLLHGFNRRFTKDSSAVTYDVAYPIPLVETIRTKYVIGSLARSTFSYDRLVFGGLRVRSDLLLLYQIYEPGDWEIIIYFSDEAPLFTND